MEKKRFGPKLKMEALPKCSKARVKFLNLPIEIETPFDTGHGENKNSKWEMPIYLYEHPTMDITGVMVWQTTASVIRLEIMGLINNGTKKDTEHLLKDLKSCEWNITCDANGQLALEEI